MATARTKNSELERMEIGQVYEEHYALQARNKNISELNPEERYRIETNATRACLETGKDPNLVAHILTVYACEEGRQIDQPELYAQTLVAKSEKFLAQRHNDISFCTQIANTYSNPEAFEQDKLKIAGILHKASPNLSRLGNDKEEQKTYVKNVLHKSFSASRIHFEVKDRWQNINTPPLENPQKDPVKAYQIAANVPYQTKENGHEMDLYACRRMAGEGYSKEDITKALRLGSPHAAAKAKPYIENTFKKLEKESDFKKNLGKSKVQSTQQSL